MPVYRTILIRAFAVEVIADDEQRAAILAELFVGFNDESKTADRERLNFQIQEIELIQNDAIETELIECTYD